MAKKRANQELKAAAEPPNDPGIRPVRLALSNRHHRILRLIAADEDVHMSDYVQRLIVDHLEREAATRGIKD